MITRSQASLGLLFFALAPGCAHKGIDSRQEAARQPAAAATAKPPLSDLDTVLWGDLLHVDTHGKQVRRTMQTRFWTDMDSSHLREGAGDALKNALMKSLTDESDPSIGFAKKLQANLIENILKEFVLTLKVYKIINKTLQFDVYFLPELDSPASLSNEFSSNGLVLLEKTGQLSRKLDLLDKRKITSSLADFARDSREIAPPDRSGARLIGSMLTVHIKILDMNWDPSKPIPLPKRNAVKGFLRMRRYFAVNEPSAGGSECGNGVKIHAIKNSAGEGPHEQWLTVDAFSTFNLASFAPKADRIEIYPGRLMASNRGSRDLLPNRSDFTGKTLKSGELTLELQAPGTPLFKVAAKKLTFTLQGELNRIDSDLTLYPTYDPEEGNWNIPAAHEQAIDSCGEEIIQQLRWNRLFSRWQPLGQGDLQ